MRNVGATSIILTILSLSTALVFTVYQAQTWQISSEGAVIYESKVPDFAKNLYRLRYVITTTSDWTNLRILSGQSNKVVRYDVVEDPDNSDLHILWNSTDIGMYKKPYDLRSTTVVFTLLLFSSGQGLTVIYDLSKGSIGNTSVSISNYNGLLEQLVTTVTNTNTGNTFNSLPFQTSTDALTSGGPVDINFEAEKKVLAIYYPWYGTLWGPHKSWDGWGGYGYSPDVILDDKRQTATADYPLEGLYDSWDPQLIRAHVASLRDVGVDGMICSWSGVGDKTDAAFQMILNETMQTTNVSATILYETTKNESIGDIDEYSRIVGNLSYVLDLYANEPSFLKENGKPVIFIYAVDLYATSFWKDVLGCLKTNHDALFIADTWDLGYLDCFDGLFKYISTNLDDADLQFRSQYASLYAHSWSLLTGESKSKMFIGGVFPGYDDTKIRTPGLKVSRDDGFLYERRWNDSISAAPDWITVTSFNEWKEGTEIEPSLEYGWLYMNLTCEYSSLFKK